VLLDDRQISLPASAFQEQRIHVTAGRREPPSHHGLLSIVVTVVTVVVVVLIVVVVVVIVVVVENVGVTGQRNVARGELAARPVSLTRPGTDFVADPFAASHFLSLSLSLSTRRV